MPRHNHSHTKAQGEKTKATKKVSHPDAKSFNDTVVVAKALTHRVELNIEIKRELEARGLLGAK